MTERKIVLYLEQKTISEVYQDAFEKIKYESDTTPTLYLKKVEYYTFNSLGNEIENIFNKLKIDRSILIDIRERSIGKIALIKFSLIQKHLYKKSFERKKDEDFVIKMIDDFSKKGISLLLKIEDEFLLEKIKIMSTSLKNLNLFFLKDDIILVKRFLRSDPLRYRLYLNDRLLVERYYPIDIEHNRMVAETVYLNDNASGELRVESNFDLQIKRVEIDGQKHDTYSTSFQLPHTDK